MVEAGERRIQWRRARGEMKSGRSGGPNLRSRNQHRLGCATSLSVNSTSKPLSLVCGMRHVNMMVSWWDWWLVDRCGEKGEGERERGEGNEVGRQVSITVCFNCRARPNVSCRAYVYPPLTQTAQLSTPLPTALPNPSILLPCRPARRIPRVGCLQGADSGLLLTIHVLVQHRMSSPRFAPSPSQI